MKKPALLGLVLGLVLAAGCSSSSTRNSMTAGTGGDSASNMAGSGAAAGGGTQEGKACRTDAQCMAGLSCVSSVVGTTVFHHCARSCSKTQPCHDDEMCLTSTGNANDVFCRKTIKEASKPCGPGVTSYCELPLDCIFPDVVEGIPVGTCFNYCLLPTSSARLPSDVLVSCPNGLTCARVGDPDVGLCAMTAARDAMCGFEIGKLCAAGDDCVMDDVSGASTCYQDCTKNGMCANGKPCTPIDSSTSICADAQ
jgi:hypothetical protein